MRRSLIVVLTACMLVVVLCRMSDAARLCPQSPSPIPIPNLATSPPARIAQALKTFDLFMKNVTTINNLPGVVVQMVYDQTPFFFGGYGRNNWTNPSSPPPSQDNIVWIASITKVLTSMLTYQLRDDGIWSMDDPLTKFYPDFEPYSPSKASRPLTLRSLAAHTSGLPRENPCPGCPEPTILTTLSDQYTLWAPNREPHYSNLGFSFLGRAAEKALPDQQVWEDIIAKRMLLPMNMTSSGFDFTPAVQARMAVGRDAGQAAQILDLGWEAPSGSLYSTARDMAQFMSQLFRTDTPRSATQVLDGTTINELLEGVSNLRDGRGVYGLPFEFEYLPTQGDWSGKWLKSKAGMLPGYRSQMALAPDIKLGIFISVLTSDPFNDTTESAFTVQAMNMVGTAIEATLKDMQAVPAPFPDTQWWFEGLYYINQVSLTRSMQVRGFDGKVKIIKPRYDSEGEPQPNIVSIKVFSQGDQLMISSQDGLTIRLSAVPGAVPNFMYRATQLNTDNITCRWLSDGIDGEMIYFVKDEVTPRMAKVFIQDQLWQRVL